MAKPSRKRRDKKTAETRTRFVAGMSAVSAVSNIGRLLLEVIRWWNT